MNSQDISRNLGYASEARTESFSDREEGGGRGGIRTSQEGYDVELESCLWSKWQTSLKNFIWFSNLGFSNVRMSVQETGRCPRFRRLARRAEARGAP